MSVQHNAIQSADAHEPKHITTAATTDSGKVLTPSHTTNAISELRQLDASEITVTGTTTLSVPTLVAAWLTYLFPNGVQAGVSKKVTSASVTTAYTPALPADEFSLTLGGALTMAAPTGTPSDGQRITFRLIQDATGSRLVTGNAAYRFSAGTPPTLTATASKTDYVTFEWNAVASKWDNVRTSLNY